MWLEVAGTLYVAPDFRLACISYALHAPARGIGTQAPVTLWERDMRLGI